MALRAHFHFSRFRGVNNVDDPIRVAGRDAREAPGYTSLVSADDCDIDSMYKISQRDGYVSRASGNIHSLWSDGKEMCLFVEGTELKRLNVDFSSTTIKSGLSPGLAMSYAEVNDNVVVTNQQIIGYIEAGIYSDFEAPDDHGKVSPMAGHIVAYFNGRIVVAKGSTVFYSDAMALNSFDLRRNYHQFPGVITMMAPVEDGMYVSDGEKTYFVDGRDFATASLRTLVDYPAIPGTAAKIDSGLAGREGFSGPAYMWASEQGICIGANNGSFRNLTQKYYRPPSLKSRGAGIFMRNKSKYIAALHN
jgi:hypothetical protein